MSYKWEPVHLSCSEGLVRVHSRSSSIGVEGRASSIRIVGGSLSIGVAAKGSSECIVGAHLSELREELRQYEL